MLKHIGLTKNLFISVCVACALVVSGCGFKLRGKFEIPASMQTLQISGYKLDQDFLKTLEKGLRSSDIVITESAKNVGRLELADVIYTRDVRLTDANGLALGYTLKKEVEYGLRGANGRFKRLKATQTRALNFSAAQALQADEEEDFLQEQMDKELALTILRQIARFES